jgi:membrane-associated protein
MDLISAAIQFILHIDKYLGDFITYYGALSYVILFAIIFAETGLVFTPFLPGDSLLFAAGAFAAIGSFNILLLTLILWLAAFLGDTANYFIGRFFGQKMVDNPRIPINQNHIDKTQKFYDQYGGKAIFWSRFLPIVRTFAPFIAGIGKMNYKKFISYNAAGGAVWVLCFTLLGYFFGNITVVKKNFSGVIIVIIALSVVPALIEFAKAKMRKK